MKTEPKLPLEVTTIVEVFLSSSTGRYHWRLRSRANKKIVATPSEGFFDKSNAKRAIKTLLSRLKTDPSTYVIVDLS